MKKNILFFISIFGFIVVCMGQTDTLFNQVDGRGLRQGYWKRTMTENGKTYLYAIENFKDGRKNGLCIYFFSNGRKQAEINYKNDTLNGLSKIYRTYGGLQYEENFENGKTHGFKKYFDSDGDLKEEQEYTEGVETGIYRLYSKKNNVVVESYDINGVENGVRKVYSDNDKHELISETDFKNGSRVETRYYKKGKLVKTHKYDYNEELRKDEELREKYKTIDG